MISPQRVHGPQGRLGVFWVWQAPTVLFALYIWSGIEVTPSLSVESKGITGFGLIALATAIAFMSWWFGQRHVLLAVPVLDVAGVALIQADTTPLAVTVQLLAILPLMWLAFEFDSPGTVLSLTGAIVIALVPFLGPERLPSNRLEIFNSTMFPLVLLCLTVVVRTSAWRLRLNAAAIKETSAELSRALSLAQDRLLTSEAIIKSVDAAITYIDENGQLALINDEAIILAERAAWSSQDPEAQSAHIYAADRVTPVRHDLRVSSCAKRGETVPARLEWIGPPGDQQGVMIGAHQLTRGDGSAMGFVISASDITAILEAIRVREEFLTTVSHELRTPLTSIIGYQELIEDVLDTASAQRTAHAAPVDAGEADTRDASIREALLVAQRNAHTLRERIAQLLDSADTLVLNPRDTDVSQLVAEGLNKHTRAAESADLTLRATLTSGIRAEIDPTKWEQALDNLLTNALKYTPAGGTITVSLECQAEENAAGPSTAVPASEGFVVTVTDTGIGMSSSDLTQAFDRFYRAESVGRDAVQGIGVGLSIAQSIAHGHGGHINLASSPGLGATASMFTPVAGQDTSRQSGLQVPAAVLAHSPSGLTPAR